MKIFDKIRVSIPKKNKFDLSHERKLTMAMGELVPVMVQEVLPGDSFRCQTEVFVRLFPMLAPIMHRVNVTCHSWFVPYRIVWDEWEEFITGGETGLPPFPVMPHMMTATMFDQNQGVTEASLSDYLGLPLLQSNVQSVPIQALWYRAYQLIYNTYYRDQNLQAEIEFGLGSGVISDPGEIAALCSIRKRCWEKDYLTSCLPFAQRGAAVEIPIDLAGYAPVTADPLNVGTVSATVSGTEQPGALGVGYGIDVTDPDVPTDNALYARIAGLASTTTINALRRAQELQRWLEAMARGGARYAEQLMNIWGKRSSDARLQRPEYLGGYKAPVRISEVLQTVNDVQTLDGDPLGTMGGHGYSIGKGNGFKRSFEEHGVVITLMSVLPVTAYQDGIPREMSRMDKLDFPWPQFANIGEQEVLEKEVYFNGAAAGSNPLADDTFGYQSRYAECKYKPSTVHGDMRTELDFWHMGRKLAGPMELNEFFVESDPTTRIFPDPSNAYTVIAQVYHKFDALRPLPYFGTPI